MGEFDQLCSQYSQACKLKQEGKTLASLKEAEKEPEKVAEGEGKSADQGGESGGQEEEDMETEGGEPGTGEATHWSQLDTKAMKVAELRSELTARGQNSKGIKTQLAAKLQQCLDEEKEKEAAENKEKDMETEGGEPGTGEATHWSQL